MTTSLSVCQKNKIISSVDMTSKVHELTFKLQKNPTSTVLLTSARKARDAISSHLLTLSSLKKINVNTNARRYYNELLRELTRTIHNAETAILVKGGFIEEMVQVVDTTDCITDFFDDDVLTAAPLSTLESRDSIIPLFKSEGKLKLSSFYAVTDTLKLSSLCNPDKISSLSLIRVPKNTSSSTSGGGWSRETSRTVNGDDIVTFRSFSKNGNGIKFAYSYCERGGYLILSKDFDATYRLFSTRVNNEFFVSSERVFENSSVFILRLSVEGSSELFKDISKTPAAFSKVNVISAISRSIMSIMAFVPELSVFTVAVSAATADKAAVEKEVIAATILGTKILSLDSLLTESTSAAINVDYDDDRFMFWAKAFSFSGFTNPVINRYVLCDDDDDMSSRSLSIDMVRDSSRREEEEKNRFHAQNVIAAAGTRHIAYGVLRRTKEPPLPRFITSFKFFVEDSNIVDNIRKYFAQVRGNNVCGVLNQQAETMLFTRDDDNNSLESLDKSKIADTVGSFYIGNSISITSILSDCITLAILAPKFKTSFVINSSSSSSGGEDCGGSKPPAVTRLIFSQAIMAFIVFAFKAARATDVIVLHEDDADVDRKTSPIASKVLLFFTNGFQRSFLNKAKGCGNDDDDVVIEKTTVKQITFSEFINAARLTDFQTSVFIENAFKSFIFHAGSAAAASLQGDSVVFRIDKNTQL